MSNKPSSVDILCQKLANKLGLQAITFYIDHAEEIAEAKAKHEEEIKDAWDKGDYCIDLPDGSWEQKYKSAEQYYNETFNTKEK